MGRNQHGYVSTQLVSSFHRAQANARNMVAPSARHQTKSSTLRDSPAYKLRVWDPRDVESAPPQVLPAFSPRCNVRARCRTAPDDRALRGSSLGHQSAAKARERVARVARVLEPRYSYSKAKRQAPSATQIREDRVRASAARP